VSPNALDEISQYALDPATSVAISACAGSGKTWLLVSRIVRLLLAGNSPSEILAITFTRKAAQEMSSRLRDWLRLLAVADEADVRVFLRARGVDLSATEVKIAEARSLFERVATADPPITITTFHSWFLQLLRNAPLEGGMLGAVTLVDRTSVLLDEAWDRLMTTCRRAPQNPAAASLQQLFRDYGLDNTRRMLRNFVSRRAEWWAYAGIGDDAVDRATDALRVRIGVDPDSNPVLAFFADGQVVAELDAFASLLDRNGPAGRKLASRLADARATNDTELVFQGIRQVVFTQQGKPRQMKGTKALQDQAGPQAAARLTTLHASLAERLSAVMRACTDQRSYRINRAGLTAGARLLASFQALKQERQALDFTDIEWLAFNALSRSSFAVTMQFKLDSRYRHVLLDEVQDTNPLQWHALQAWFNAARETGNSPGLFIVGDPKQSIYRFRRADSRLFDSASAFVLASGGRQLSHDESRRCAAPILDAVNRTFAAAPELFKPFNTHRAHYPRLPARVEVLPLAGLVTDRTPNVDAAPTVELRNPLTTPRELPEDRRRDDEGRMLADGILAMVGRYGISDDPHAPATRRAHFGDIMVLVRRRTHLQAYERALRHAGVPYISSRQGGLLDTLEANDLTALLQFLVAPFDDIKLAQVLRSPMFDLDDTDLIAVSGSTGATWWERLRTCADRAEPGKLARARDLLTRWLKRADAVPVHDQLDRIYFEADVLRRYESAVPSAMRAAVVANLQSYIQYALNTDAGRYPSLPRFIAELADMRTAPAEEAPDEGVLGDHGNAVRILTVHGAKGLEAPIVWLLDCNSTPPATRGYDAMVDWPVNERAPSSFSLWTRSEEMNTEQQRLAAIDSQSAQREDLNLLYVAMTRARQVLVASGCATRTSALTWYRRIRDAVVAVRGVSDDADTMAVAIGDDLSIGTESNMHGPQDEVGAAKPAPLACPCSPSQPVGFRRAAIATGGQSYGIDFHRMLEVISETPGIEPDVLRQRLRLASADFEMLWPRARHLLEDPALARFFDPRCFVRAFNEVSILTAAGELRRIDRVIEYQREVWILDYKTGQPDAVLGTSLEREYRAQLLQYRTALAEIYPDKPVFATLLFADGSLLPL
jgi:ATP-dependent helicase/nuclease subunit A